MKVITGKYKNRNLKTLKSLNTRPTLTRTKIDIFNVINNYFYFEDKIVLDIFSGSGSLGIEALSRGCKYCYFNDLNKSAYDIIKINLNSLNIKTFSIFNLSYILLLKYIINSNKRFDLIFIDPPFRKHIYYYNIFNSIFKDNLLNNFGILVIESNFDLNLDKYIKVYSLKILKFKKYSYRRLYILRREN